MYLVPSQLHDTQLDLVPLRRQAAVQLPEGMTVREAWEALAHAALIGLVLGVISHLVV